jgi:hypothetical protein
MRLRIQKILQDTTRTPYTNFISIRIIDDVNGNVMYSSSKFNPTTDNIPTTITKRTGVYRVVVYDSAGIS